MRAHEQGSFMLERSAAVTDGPGIRAHGRVRGHIRVQVRDLYTGHGGAAR